jgi:hypothetical protein
VTWLGALLALRVGAAELLEWDRLERAVGEVVA